MKISIDSMISKSVAIVPALFLTASTFGVFAQNAPPSNEARVPTHEAHDGFRDGHSGPAGDEHGWGHHHGPRGEGRPGMFMQQMAGLKTSLRLTPAQTALWDKAEKASAPNEALRTKRQENMKSERETFLKLIADPSFDPRRFDADSGKGRAALQAEAEAQRQVTKEAWFTVYDSLDTAQRGQVREFLRSRVEKMHPGMFGGFGGMGPRGDFGR